MNKHDTRIELIIMCLCCIIVFFCMGFYFIPHESESKDDSMKEIISDMKHRIDVAVSDVKSLKRDNAKLQKQLSMLNNVSVDTSHIYYADSTILVEILPATSVKDKTYYLVYQNSNNALPRIYDNSGRYIEFSVEKVYNALNVKSDDFTIVSYPITGTRYTFIMYLETEVWKDNIDKVVEDLHKRIQISVG